MYRNYFDQLNIAIPLLMRENNIPGFSIAVADRERVIFSGSYGCCDVSKLTPITRETQFSLQSISKMYTAFGFMMAVEDGKVALDDPLKRLVPAFSVSHKDGGDYSGLITFRHLLKHRSGLRHEAPVGNNFSYHGSFEEHIRSINNTFLRFRPDEDYSYSNLGIDLVAYVLGKMYDMPFEDYMLQKVFWPLNMAHSTYSQKEFLLHTDSALGHGKESLVKYPIPMVGAGGMYSCADDMAHFILCFLNDGRYGNKRILEPVHVRQMYQEYPASDAWPYNLGMVVGLLKGRTVLNHNGGGFGFFATQDILPAAGFGAAAVTNSVEHPNMQLKVIRDMWSDFFDLQDALLEDCSRVEDAHAAWIGLYEATYNGGSHKIAVIPRNGRLYCHDKCLNHHAGYLFFTENNDCIEFADDGMTYDNVSYRKVL